MEVMSGSANHPPIMNISDVSPTGSLNANPKTNLTPGNNSTAKKMGMGRQEFLKLLLTQMKHQDPMNPMKGQEFAAHLARFSSVEQLMNINETLQSRDGMTKQLTESLNSSVAAGLIGKTVQAGGNTITLQDGKETDISFSLGARAEKVTLQVLDPTGRAVRTIEKDNLKSGEHTLTWNGKNNDGAQMPDGPYRIAIAAQNANNNPVPTQTYLQGVVDRVRFTDGGVELSVNGNMVPLQNVRTVAP